MNFDAHVPQCKLGMLLPLPVVDNVAYEFYQAAPPGVMLVATPGSIAEFDVSDMARVMTSFDVDTDRLVERQVDIIVQAGVPLVTLIGLEAHDRMVAHIAARAKRPVCSQMENIVAAARHLGLGKIAVANKWSAAMNETLARYFARGGMSVVGVVNDLVHPEKTVRQSTRSNMEFAYRLCRQALVDHPSADGVYLGGGAWLSEAVAIALEAEFKKPVFTNMQATIWDVLHRLDKWRPQTGRGVLLASS